MQKIPFAQASYIFVTLISTDLSTETVGKREILFSSGCLAPYTENPLDYRAIQIHPKCNPPHLLGII